MKKDAKIYLALIIAVIIIIAGILVIKNMNPSGEWNKKTVECIAKKSILYSQTTCIHCKEQKAILGNYTSLFNIIECDHNPQDCIEANIQGTPTWIINNQTVLGIQTVEQLKKLSGC
jgi:hypothetical protein